LEIDVGVARHQLLHIHVEYQGQVGVYAIEDGTLFFGSLQLADWELTANGEQPFKIRGHDQ
jgi:hypothetical protein